MDAFVVWLQSTSLSQAIVIRTWIWPLCETLHFIGLALIIGIVGFFDLRLIGAFRSIAVAAARDLMPLALAGFLLNAVTGTIFLIGHPEQYAHNVTWWMKLAFLGVAGLNAAVFETTAARGNLQGGANGETTGAAKAIGVVSLIAWFGVLFWGRMLPFIGDAY